MTEINIEKADGTFVSLNSKKPLRAVKSAVMKDELMGEDTVTLTVESAEPIEFAVGDKLQALGKTYFLNSPAKVQRTGRRYLTYTVVWESAKYDLSKVVMVNEFAGGKETVNETEFDYTGEFTRLMDLLVSNMCRVYGKGSWTWKTVNTGTDSAFKPDYEQCKTLSFSSENVLSALNTVCQEWNSEFRIGAENGAHVIEVGRIGRNVYEYVFAYGRGNGLYTLTRDRNADTALVTRLYAYGASGNLGTKYRAGRRRLALPEKHVSPLVRNGLYVQDDALVERFGLSEGAVVFDEIFPSRRGTVSAVDGTDELKFTDQDMFDLNEKDEKGDSKYILGSAAPTIRFNTGNLGGYEFSLAGYNSLTKTFTLVPFTDENDYRYPSQDDKAFRIGVGDTYVLLNIALPDTYVAEAEAKLADRALEKYGQLYKKLYSYALEMDPVFVKERFPNAGYAPAFRAGDYVNIKDEDLIDVASEGLGDHTVAVKIASVSVDLYNPFGYTLGLSDSAPSSVITQIVKSEKDTQKIIQVNNLSDPARARRNLRTTAELLEMTFDTDGYFVDGRLKPETVETKMIAVGALSQQFLLDGVVFTPDLNGDVSAVGFSEGVLTHLGLDRTENKVWSLLPGQVSGLKDDTVYHIYARCQKKGSGGTMVVTPEALRYDADADFYHFSVGVLSSAREGFRRISLTYGSSTINGREITAGRISAANGKAYFDLDKGEIGGRIVFSSDAVFRDDKGAEGTLITDGKINTSLIDADKVVAGAASIANFEIQGNLLQGVDSHIVFQNEDIESLAGLMSPKEGQMIDVSGGALASGTFSNETVTDTVYSYVNAFQDFTVGYPGVLKFSIAAGRTDVLSPVEGGGAYFAPVDGGQNEYKCEVLRKTGKDTYEPIDTFRPSGNGTFISPKYFDRSIYIPSAGDYRIRFVMESTDRIYWERRPEGWENNYPILTTNLSAAITGQSSADRGHIYFAGSAALTKIGTNGLYSFWSLYNYLYFSQSEGLKIKAGTTLSSPNGEYSLTVNDNGISISGPTGTNASNNVVDFTVAGTRVNIATGEKLSVAFGKIARFLSDLKAVAFSGDYNDLSNRPSVPAKVSQLSNDSGFITKSVSDLANYYLKNQTYTRDEIQALIATVKTASFQVVAALPASGQDNIIYLVPKQGAAPDTHDEYIWVENAWELIGNTKVDISGKLDKTGDASGTTVIFAQETGEPASGAKLGVNIGRLVKKVADIVSGAVKVAKASLADTAAKAVNDENGRNIPQTYATKGEITNVQVGGRNYVTGLKDNWIGGIVNSDGTITLGNNYNQMTKDFQEIAFLAGKSATVSVNPNVILSGTDRLKLSFRIAFYTQDFLFISYSSGDGNAPLSLTVPEDAYYCKASVGLGVYGYVANNFDTIHFQLEFGNKATDYGLAPQDIARINGEYPDMKVGKATADGDGNKIPDTYATQKGTYPSLTVGKATKADQDKNGNDIPATYYKKAGDVMTGTLRQKKGECTILNDVASMRIPSGHKGWIALDFGLDTVSVIGEISLYKYGWGGIVIDFSGYTYVGTGGANNWNYPRYGVRGSIGTMPQIAFAKDNATGHRYILVGGDNFTWGQYDYIALPRVILGSIGNDTRDRTWAFSALTGTLAELGMTTQWTADPSVGIEVDKARNADKATQADTVDGLHAAAAGSVENGKLASYDPSGRLKATVLETASFLRTGSGPDTGLSFGTDSIPGTHTPYYGIFVANPSEIGLSGYGDVTSDYAILSPVAGYNTATNNNRGWMFYNPVTKAIAASLSQRGYAKFAGEVTASAFRGNADSATKAVNDGNGLNIPNNYTRKSYIRPGATWSAVGWYRMYIAGSPDNPGGTVTLNVATLYWNTPSQLLSLLISVGPRDVVVQQLNACYNYPISKVRVCRKANTAFCVDVYCNDARNNSIFANQCGGDGYIVDTAMLNPSVDGYTTTEFDIRAGDRPMQLSEKPGVYLSRPSVPKNGDIVISVTD